MTYINIALYLKILLQYYIHFLSINTEIPNRGAANFIKGSTKLFEIYFLLYYLCNNNKK